MARRPSELGEQRRSQSAQVGQLLLQARVAAGRSQTEAAERLGLLQPAIAKLEAGTRRLTFAEALELARFYGVSPLMFDPAEVNQAKGSEAS